MSIFALSLALVTCGRDEGTSSASTAGPNPAAADIESGIIDEIRARFNSDEVVRGHAIDVTVENGIATLRGTVRSERAGERAVGLAQSVKGVRGVNDALEVSAKAASACDCLDEHRITRHIQAQFFLDPEIKHRDIQISTTSTGVVRLDGTVSSIEAKEQAVRLVRGTPGVTRVDNRLTVE